MGKDGILPGIAKAYFLSIAAIFGSREKMLLEHRAFNATLFLVFLAGISTIFINVFIHLPPISLIIGIISILFSFSFYLVSRLSGRWRPLMLPSFFLFLCLLTFGWITQGGLTGSMTFFFFLLSGSAIICFDKRQKLISLTAVTIALITLAILEYYRPEIIWPYATPKQRYMDIASCLILCLIINAFMTYIVFREFQREREARNSLLESLRVEKEKVEKTVIEKHRLLSMVCHDSASALSLVTINTSLALKSLALKSHSRSFDSNDPKTVPSIDEIIEKANYGAMKINEILCSVRLIQGIEEGTASFKPVRVSLCAVFNDVMLLMERRLQDKGITLSTSFQGKEDFVIKTDQGILCNHILCNIVSNAIKFSYSGTTIKIGAWKENNTTYLTITDHGIGIPKEMMGKIFNPAMKISRKGTIGETGTGLGLLIVKSFVDMLAGTIQIESKSEDEYPLDHGTTVQLTFGE
jgi:signal transduction histidine kinase